MSELEVLRAPTFPPLMQGEAVSGASDPMEIAQARAVLGCDAGLVVHNLQADRLRAAVVLTPEVPLAEAMAMLPLAGVAFQNALGAQAPPEVAVHLEWDGGIRVNGAQCGRLHAAASDNDPDKMPLWLIVGLDLPLMSLCDAPGHAPDMTTLYDEGCAEVEGVQLVESWTRHMLTWVNRWLDEGNAPLHADWLGMAHGVGEPMRLNGMSGTYLGVDEYFGLLLREDAKTHLIPLTQVLEDTS